MDILKIDVEIVWSTLSIAYAKHLVKRNTVGVGTFCQFSKLTLGLSIPDTTWHIELRKLHSLQITSCSSSRK